MMSGYLPKILYLPVSVWTRVWSYAEDQRTRITNSLVDSGEMGVISASVDARVMGHFEPGRFGVNVTHVAFARGFNTVLSFFF